MEVFVGPTFSIEVSPPAYVTEAAQDKHAMASSCLFLKEEDDCGGSSSSTGICAPKDPRRADVSSDSSSSIGAPDDSDDDGGGASFHGGDVDADNEVESKLRVGSLSSLDSLEESLPIKRGLSNHFSGKSKSFANLSDVSSVMDLKKRENPLNKRRRILIASKWARKSFYSWANPKSMPLLTLNEDEEHHHHHHHHHHHQAQSSSMENKEKEEHESQDEEEEDYDDDDDESCRFGHEGLSKLHGKRLNSFKMRSCFSLADLQEHRG
ncbi:stress response NST1-like protein [Parasponia andersonii]|uniref:Stress response NST1-like protein n=1 Tax=Parasponia andersonii TaxID=3476 RepID=A0A2P5DIG9_PARAD|nr:stress response NST1-like protein [Parasponia andersonii]